MSSGQVSDECFRDCPVSRSVEQNRKTLVQLLALGLTARELLHFGFLRAAWFSTFGLGRGLFAGGAFYCLAFCFVGDAFCICHETLIAPIFDVQFKFKCGCSVQIQMRMFSSNSAADVQFKFSCGCSVQIEMRMFSSNSAADVQFKLKCGMFSSDSVAYFNSDSVHGRWRLLAAGFSNPLQLGEPFYQLLHAVMCKLYCNFGIFPISFAAKDDAFAVFGVADSLAVAEAGGLLG
jgi:hypothetical protein